MDEMYEVEDALQVRYVRPLHNERVRRKKCRTCDGPDVIAMRRTNSIDTDASSPVKRNGTRFPILIVWNSQVIRTDRQRVPYRDVGHRRNESARDGSNSDSDSDDDDHDDPFGSRVDSDDNDDSDASSSSVEMPSKMASIGFHDAEDDRGGGDADAEDSDEPPEIPGSPMAMQVTRAPPIEPASSGNGRMDRLGEVNIGETSWPRIEDATRSNGGANILQVHRSDSDSSSSSGDDDEYVVKDAEQPRSAEFHAFSSSESDDGDDSDDDDRGNNSLHATRRSSRSSQQVSITSRPKTAAKDLECYRDVIPDEFFQQIGSEAGDSHDTPPKKEKRGSRQQHTKTSSSGASSINNGLNGPKSAELTPAQASRIQSQKYAVSVPQEVENLFQVCQIDSELCGFSCCSQ